MRDWLPADRTRQIVTMTALLTARREDIALIDVEASTFTLWDLRTRRVVFGEHAQEPALDEYDTRVMW